MISQISKRSPNTGVNKLACGFTLIELLLVLVIMAISVVTITPQLGKSILSWQIREDSRSMLAAIRLARQFAVTRQEIMAFTVDTDKGSFTVKDIGSFSDLDGKNNNSLVSRQFLGKGVRIVRVENFEQVGNEQGLVFWPDGGTKAAHVTLSTDEEGETVGWHIHS